MRHVNVTHGHYFDSYVQSEAIGEKAALRAATNQKFEINAEI
jgi:hypothetical protein